METFLIFTPLELILLAIAIFLLIIQYIYYFKIYNQIYLHNKECDAGKVSYTDYHAPISVIICAHDDSHYLRQHLPSILEQDYPDFEVIVINDGSTDESEDLLKILATQYPNLYHTFTPAGSRYLSRKKLAMTLGIKASKNPWLVFIEPNCVPASNQWLRLMARNFTQKTEVVLGYSNCKSPQGWLNKQATFNLFFSAVRYLGYALIGKPYMGVGRNLAYRRDTFFREKGFSNHLDLLRGEDNLFINRIAKASNTRVETNPAATVQVEPYHYAKEWREERLSYLATSRFYKGNQRYWLGFETTSRLCFYATWIAGIIISTIGLNWVMLGLFILIPILRFITQAIVLNRVAKSLKQQISFIGKLPFYDFFIPIQTLQLKLSLMVKGNRSFKRK